MTYQNLTDAVKYGGLILIVAFFLYSLPFITANLSGKISSNGVQPTPTQGIGDGGPVKEVLLQFKDYNYYPNTITVKKGQTLRLVGDLTSTDKLIGCYTFVRIPGAGISKRMVFGDNVIEFTPSTAGTVPFSCGMNMGRGQIIVE